MKKNIVVLSGAGISAESGINTFRDADGLWEGHDVMEVASPLGWQKNPALVLDFYNQRRKQLLDVFPNEGHTALVELEQYFNVCVVTQNVDDLHERAGSRDVMHIHGELLKSQSTINLDVTYPCLTDINIGDCCELGGQLRPFIVWFGEEVPLLDAAIAKIIEADIVIVVGSSMQVYPAAGLVSFAPADSRVYYVDPKPSVNDALAQAATLEVIESTAVVGLPKLTKQLIDAL